MRAWIMIILVLMSAPVVLAVYHSGSDFTMTAVQSNIGRAATSGDKLIGDAGGLNIAGRREGTDFDANDGPFTQTMTSSVVQTVTTVEVTTTTSAASGAGQIIIIYWDWI